VVDLGGAVFPVESVIAPVTLSALFAEVNFLKRALKLMALLQKETCN